ncbi:MAG TPA: glycosyltransferase family 2 protein [Verrucomicrobiae bacterium]|nr:glycosyltransferase family 2 protein [Verrucomicrobiae bacterium]
MSQSHAVQPKISVIILNYNGREWLPRCFESLERQTIFSDIEVILTDNHSADGSDELAAAWLAKTGKGRVVQNGANLFYCGANNNGAAAATGEFLLFLNNDTWLEPDCLEKLAAETAGARADCAAPAVFDYDDNTFQSGGDVGLDLFGLPTLMAPAWRTQETFAAPGCSLLIKTELFRKIGGFPPELLIYADETDLSWRVWIAGGKVVAVPSARLHHRGAAVVNPEGKTQTVESRTTEFKRFLANRNGILFLLKNSQHILLLLLIPHLLLLFVEAGVNLVLTRQWSYIRKSYLSAVIEAFRMRGHVRQWRRRIRGFRQRSDFWMLRFLRLRPSRWPELKRLFKFGPPKVDAK